MWNKASSVLKVSLKLNDENWRTNSLTSLEPQSERSSPSCTVFESRFKWDVVFDRWSTRKSIGVHRKAFRATILLAYPRGLLLSRIYPILWHKLWPLFFLTAMWYKSSEVATWRQTECTVRSVRKKKEPSNFDQESIGKLAQARKMTPCGPKSVKTWTGTHGEKVENSAGIARPVNVIVMHSKIRWNMVMLLRTRHWCTKLFGCRATSRCWKKASRIWFERHSTQQDGANSDAVSVRKVVGLFLVYFDLPLYGGRKRVPPLSEIIVEFCTITPCHKDGVMQSVTFVDGHCGRHTVRVLYASCHMRQRRVRLASVSACNAGLGNHTATKPSSTDAQGTAVVSTLASMDS